MATVKVPGDDPDRLAPKRPHDDDPPSKDNHPYRSDDWHDLLEIEPRDEPDPTDA